MSLSFLATYFHVVETSRAISNPSFGVTSFLIYVTYTVYLCTSRPIWIPTTPLWL
jgi:hypothetical protein